MTKVLLDTHVWAWVLANSPRLTSRAKDTILSATSVAISSLSLFEIAQKVRLGKWPDMAPFIDHLDEQLRIQGSFAIAPTAEITLLAGRMVWEHRDPFNRLIAATAILTGSSLVSADTAFDTLPLRRVW